MKNRPKIQLTEEGKIVEVFKECPQCGRSVMRTDDFFFCTGKCGWTHGDPPVFWMAAEDPLIRATKKAYRASATGKVEALFAERSRWSRKATIARNKLAEVDQKIAQAALELAKQIDGVKPEEKKP